MPSSTARLALLVPVYNEEDSILPFVDALDAALPELAPQLGIVFIDDGSTDRTAEVLSVLLERDPRVGVIALTRNFGKEAALTAAFDLVDADAVIPMDVDLQDPPELIREFVRIWREEAVDMVYGVRSHRDADTKLKRLTASWFYRTFNRLSPRVKLPENAGDYRLLSRRALLTMRTLHERNRFMKGLFAWPGFKSRAINFERAPRARGNSKWSFWKLWNFALDGIVSFSSLPLRVWSYLGGFVAVLALIYMLVIFIRTLIMGVDSPGYASLMCAILFLGAVQLISIGVIGEYLARMHEEVKQRPIYIVSSILGCLGTHPGSKADKELSCADNKN